MRKLFSISLFLVFTLLPFHSSAEGIGYSYFGFGKSDLQYSEESQEGRIASEFNSDSIDFSTGGYVAINSRMGFYLHSSKSLIEGTETETWEYEGSKVQFNSMSVSASDTSLSGSYTPFPKHSVVLGVDFSTTSFRRFDFEITEDGEQLGVLNPNGNNDRDDFDVADAISESQLTVHAVAGYKFGNLFIQSESRKSPWVYLLSAHVGFPVYASVKNSSIGKNETVSGNPGGLLISSEVLLGRHLTDEVVLAGVLSYRQTKRGELDSDLAILPKSTTTRSTLSIRVLWSF